MAELANKPLWLPISGTYSLRHFRLPPMDFLVEGVVRPNDFLVVPKGGTAANPDAGGASRDLSVDILLPGAAWIQGDDTPDEQGMYRVWESGTSRSRINLSIPAATGSSAVSRAVILRVDEAQQKVFPEVVSGVGTAEPVIPNNAIYLARVALANSSDTVISGSDVTDKRGRAYRSSLSATLASSVRLTLGAGNIEILRVDFTLARARPVWIGGRSRLLTGTAAAAIGLVGLRITDNGVSLPGAVAGPINMADASAAYGQRNDVTIPNDVYELAAGAHTIRLVGDRDSNGVIDASGEVTIAGFNYRPTKLVVVV